MRIALLQSDIVWEDPAANFARLDRWIEAAVVQRARLLAFPEMFACGFSMKTDRVAEDADGPSASFLLDRAQRHGLWLAGSVPERTPGSDKPANTLILAAPDGTAHRYRKIFPFSYAGEDRHYQAGTETVTVDVEGLRLTLFICYDLRFADVFWDTAPTTDAYLVIANWPETRRAHWQTLLRARAIENQAWVLGVNRVGDGGKLHYSGDSRIIDPMGAEVATASDQETLLVADIDPGAVAATRAALPFLDDRR